MDVGAEAEPEPEEGSELKSELHLETNTVMQD